MVGDNLLSHQQGGGEQWADNRSTNVAYVVVRISNRESEGSGNTGYRESEKFCSSLSPT